MGKADTRAVLSGHARCNGGSQILRRELRSNGGGELLRDCSCGGDQLFAICANAAGSTASAATGMGAGASVVTRDPVTSLPLVQCSRHGPGCCGLAFPAIVEQWLDAGWATGSGVSLPLGSSANAHACAANAHCIPKIPSRVMAATQRREVRRMAKLKHIPGPVGPRRSCQMRPHWAHLEPDQAFRLRRNPTTWMGPRVEATGLCSARPRSISYLCDLSHGSACALRE